MIRFFSVLALVSGLAAGPVFAQSGLPAPQTGAAIGQEEVRILDNFFRALGEAQESGDPDITIEDIVKDVVDVATREGDEEETRSGDEDGREGSNGKKDKKGKKDKGQGKGQGKGEGKNKGKAKGRGEGLPPGLQRQLANTGSLPPGLQRQLEKTGALPPGLVAKSLPAGLEAALPPLPEGQHRVIVDDDILVVEDITGEILDALPDIIPPDVVPVLKALPQILNQGE